MPKRREFVCPACKAVQSVRASRVTCACTKPPTICLPMSMAMHRERVAMSPTGRAATAPALQNLRPR